MSARSSSGFTLVELMVGTTILLIVMGLLILLISSISKITLRTKQEIQGFQSVRLGLETVSRKLSQAVLNPYWDYYDADGVRMTDYQKQEPATYGRYSELHFTCGPLDRYGLDSETSSHGVFFQAPLGYTRQPSLEGVKGLINIVGYHVGFYVQPAPLPFFKDQKKWGLLETVLPAEEVNFYANAFQTGSNEGSNFSWFLPFIQNSSDRRYTVSVGDNILALVLLPHYPDSEDQSLVTKSSYLTPDLFYDSRKKGPSGKEVSLSKKSGENWSASWLHLLPPIMEVYVLGMSEDSALLVNADPKLLSSLFSKSYFRDPRQIESELDEIVLSAEKKRLQFRWFKSSVVLYASRWESE